MPFNKTIEPTITHYVIRSYDNISLFYDEIERILCGGLQSGFGRNLDALSDIFSGGYGVCNGECYVHIKKSKLLTDKIKNIIQEASMTCHITVTFE